MFHEGSEFMDDLTLSFVLSNLFLGGGILFALLAFIAMLDRESSL
jgi:hypothetical protein